MHFSPKCTLQIGKCAPRGTCTPGWEPWFKQLRFEFLCNQFLSNYCAQTILEMLTAMIKLLGNAK